MYICLDLFFHDLNTLIGILGDDDALASYIERYRLANSQTMFFLLCLNWSLDGAILLTVIARVRLHHFPEMVSDQSPCCPSPPNPLWSPSLVLSRCGHQRGGLHQGERHQGDRKSVV